MARWCWIACLGLIPALARADALSGRLRLQVGQEYDSNARRIYDLGGAGLPADFLTRLVLQGHLNYQSEPHAIGLELQTGAKLFYQETDEHQVATRFQASYRRLWAPGAASGLRLALHDVTQAQHSRDYLLFTGELFVTARPADWLVVETWASGRVFHFKPDSLGPAVCPPDPEQGALRFSNQGPAVGVRFQAVLAKAWTAHLGYTFDVRFFDDRARPARITERQDQRHLANARLRFQTDWWNQNQLITQASYAVAYNDSNSAGSSAIWHRLQAIVSMQLPLDLALHLMGTLQFTSFPDGRYLDCDTYEPDADENENSLVLRLTYRLWEDLHLVAQAAIYRDAFSSSTISQPSFERETVLLGVSWGWSF
jgi:hypothetical protein